ncbi:MAG: transposase [Patescibacteria group bacterium]|jgi:transposase
MSNKLKVSLLDPWIEQAKTSGLITLKNFAVGLENDYEAVKSAFSLEWNNGQVEGHVNRLKTIKRQMYGRANFHLLRKRVLANTS